MRLGATLAIIIEMGMDTAVVVSALIAIFYTWVGGLYSVAYTDVVQLGCILIGLVISIPFAWTHEAVTPITYDSQDWIGSIGEGYSFYYADYMLLLTFGGIPWQVSVIFFNHERSEWSEDERNRLNFTNILYQIETVRRDRSKS